MKHTKLLLTLAAAACLWACGDDKEDGEVTFALEIYEIGILEGVSPASVKITAGSKEYELKVSDPSVADAEVVFGENYEYGAVRVTGKTEGTATVTVTDIVLGQQETLEVLVYEPGVELWLDYFVPEINCSDESTEKAINEDISKNMAFRYDCYYLLSREERGIFYGYNREGSVADSRFSHRTEGNSIYLEIASEEVDGSEIRTLKIIEEASDALTFYTAFFRLGQFAGTRASLPSQREPAVAYSEDLTEYYRTVYPDEGIKSVKASYRMIFNYAAFNTRYPGN
ncbi:MAG: pilus assembly protein N-terminal domain-containing protein [Alistipes sp.]|nr:pilus assembly protein N-terminal domain-containing protein [Alistipes sp.]